MKSKAEEVVKKRVEKERERLDLEFSNQRINLEDELNRSVAVKVQNELEKEKLELEQRVKADLKSKAEEVVKKRVAKEREKIESEFEEQRKNLEDQLRQKLENEMEAKIADEKLELEQRIKSELKLKAEEVVKKRVAREKELLESAFEVERKNFDLKLKQEEERLKEKAKEVVAKRIAREKQKWFSESPEVIALQNRITELETELRNKVGNLNDSTQNRIDLLQDQLTYERRQNDVWKIRYEELQESKSRELSIIQEDNRVLRLEVESQNEYVKRIAEHDEDFLDALKHKMNASKESLKQASYALQISQQQNQSIHQAAISFKAKTLESVLDMLTKSKVQKAFNLWRNI